VEDWTGLVMTQQELQVTTITRSKNSQNCHQSNKTHRENLTTYIKIASTKQHFTVLGGNGGLDTAWIQEKTKKKVQYFDKEMYLKGAILRPDKLNNVGTL